jgi:hypothetical protein
LAHTIWQLQNGRIGLALGFSVSLQWHSDMGRMVGSNDFTMGREFSLLLRGVFAGATRGFRDFLFPFAFNSDLGFFTVTTG